MNFSSERISRAQFTCQKSTSSFGVEERLLEASRVLHFVFKKKKKQARGNFVSISSCTSNSGRLKVDFNVNKAGQDTFW